MEIISNIYIKFLEKPTGLEDVEELFIEVLEAATIKFATFKGQILDMN